MVAAKRALGATGGGKAVSVINNLFLDTMQEGIVMATGGSVSGWPDSCLSELPLLTGLFSASPLCSLIFLVCLGSLFVEWNLPAPGKTPPPAFGVGLSTAAAAPPHPCVAPRG